MQSKISTGVRKNLSVTEIPRARVSVQLRAFDSAKVGLRWESVCCLRSDSSLLKKSIKGASP